MNENIKNKIKILSKINTDYSRFIVTVLESYIKRQSNISKKIKETDIIPKNQLHQSSNVIDLDSIWAKPYLFTKMRVRLEKIVELTLSTSDDEILQNPNKFCKKTIYNNAIKSFEIPDNQIDISDFIKNLSTNKDFNLNSEFIYTAENIDEETIFKEEQIRLAINILNISDAHERNKAIYNEIYTYLEEDFVSNNYCDFQNNKCISQRHLTMYPLRRKNGCCFTNPGIFCKNLKNGSCSIDCLGCKLFSCPYLTKMGIGYYAQDFVLLKSFYTKKQRDVLVFEFFIPQEEVLKKLENCK